MECIYYLFNAHSNTYFEIFIYKDHDASVAGSKKHKIIFYLTIYHRLAPAKIASKVSYLTFYCNVHTSFLFSVDEFLWLIQPLTPWDYYLYYVN